ncbi:MAG: zf-HC2 domain-containing protein, partial [Chloroflexota bacterium]|nr:zf-HC2 domain-containing protein [Chloroflexota bacterium]
MTEHPRDDLAAYALGALDEHERAAIDAHVASCDPCTAEVGGYRAALVAYADAADVAAPDLRGRIVERARRAGGASTPAAGGWIGWLR